MRKSVASGWQLVAWAPGMAACGCHARRAEILPVGPAFSTGMPGVLLVRAAGVWAHCNRWWETGAGQAGA
eukprot:344298-Alexandrium_andersonii.AAC.1